MVETGGVDDLFCQQLLDRLAEEKHVQRQAERFQCYLPHIDAWNRRRAHSMPGTMGTIEDPSHVCTIECRNTGMIHTILHGTVYGCVISGMVHICKRDSDCKYHFNDDDGVKKCVFSAKKCGESYSHSWAPHDLYDKKGTNCSGNGGPTRGIYDGTTPGADGIGTDGVLLSSYRQGYGSKKRDNLEKDIDDGWIVDFGRELENAMGEDQISGQKDTENDKTTGVLPIGRKKGTIEKDFGTTAAVISRKSRLVDELADGCKTTVKNTVNTTVMSKGVTSMNDVIQVAQSPARSPYMITPMRSGLSKSAPVTRAINSPFYPTPNYVPSLKTIVSSPINMGSPLALSSPFSSRSPKNGSGSHYSSPGGGNSKIKLGTPLQTPSGSSPFSPSPLIGGQSASEREYLKNKRKRERELQNVDAEEQRRKKNRLLLRETPYNITQLELVTKELITDFLWDNRTREAINTYRFNRKKEEADRGVEEHVIQSHRFKIVVNPKERHSEGSKRPRRRGAATYKVTKRCPLFPSMAHMDFIYWTTMAEVNSIKLVKKDTKREFYYTLLCRRLWRFISYYGEPEDSVSFVPYVHFVPGLLYMLSKDGLWVAGEQWIQPDKYLKENLPTMKDLAWRPKRKKLDGDLLATGIAKKGSKKRQILIKGTGTKPKKKKKINNWLGIKGYGGDDEEDYDDDEDDVKVKSLHQHKHGNREDLSVGGLALFFRRRKRGKKTPKFKRVEEPPGWRSLGSLQSNKEVDEETAMKHLTSFGNKGRLYSNAIITQGKRYIKENLVAFAKDKDTVDGLRNCLKEALDLY